MKSFAWRNVFGARMSLTETHRVTRAGVAARRHVTLCLPGAPVPLTVSESHFLFRCALYRPSHFIRRIILLPPTAIGSSMTAQHHISQVQRSRPCHRTQRDLLQSQKVIIVLQSWPEARTSVMASLPPARGFDTTFLRICPSCRCVVARRANHFWKPEVDLSIPACKNILVFRNVNQCYVPRRPVPARGAFRDRP